MTGEVLLALGLGLMWMASVACAVVCRNHRWALMRYRRGYTAIEPITPSRLVRAFAQLAR